MPPVMSFSLWHHTIAMLECAAVSPDDLARIFVKEPKVKYADSAECRRAGVTYHLVPKNAWDQQKDNAEYLPEAFGQDGFIHCTNGLDKLVEIANLFYTSDPRPFLALILDVSRIESPVRYDDPDELFPHIYGPLNTNAVVGLLEVRREENGTFLPFVIGSEPRT